MGIGLVLQVCVRIGYGHAQSGRVQTTRKRLSHSAAQITPPEDKMALEEMAKAWEKVAALRECDIEEPDSATDTCGQSP